MMIPFQHRVKVFVYHFDEGRPDYLLLRSSQGIESIWSPLHGPLELGEKLETAIQREVMAEVGLGRPAELIDLDMPSRFVLGDEEIIEWNFGFRAEERVDQLALDDRWAEFRWADFASAYPTLELENDRAAIIRLHTRLAEL